MTRLDISMRPHTATNEPMALAISIFGGIEPTRMQRLFIWNQLIRNVKVLEYDLWLIAVAGLPFAYYLSFCVFLCIAGSCKRDLEILWDLNQKYLSLCKHVDKTVMSS